LGAAVEKIAARKVLIDHHPLPDPAFDLTFSDAAMCSACEVAYHVIAALGDAKNLNRAVAEALYTGIFTDTGGFAFGACTPLTFRVAADLLEYGFDRDNVARRVFDSFTVSRMRLLGYTLKEKMKVFEDKHAAYISLTHNELQQYNFKAGDTEGFVNYPLSIADVVLSAFFYESEDTKHIRVSLRSKGKTLAVNDIAQRYFNGGGHFNAAGGKFTGTLNECCKQFEQILQEIKIET
jgi:phosphoesterase RecJ-like protein